MDEKDLILIDRYFAGELSPEERQMADDRRQADPAFDQVVREMEKAIEALRVYRREEMRKQFMAIDARLDGGDPGPSAKGHGRPLWMWIGLVAAVVALVLWVGNRFVPHSASEQLPAQAIDTVPQVPTTPGHISPSAPDSMETPASVPGSPVPAQRPKERKSPDGPALFAEYFEPYRDLTLEPDVRGIDDPTLADEFERQYWAGRFEGCIDTFALLPAELRQDDRFVFRLGIALMATSDFKKARQVLTQLALTRKSHLGVESAYYLALIEIREGYAKRALGFLDDYLSGNNLKHASKAKALRSVLAL